MKRILFACLLTVTPASQAQVDDTSPTEGVLEYHCSDTIVVGRVESGGYEPIPDEEDRLGHGVITATITIRRVVRGQELPKIVSANYASHASLRHDRDFMLTLHKDPDGSMWITGAQLMSVRPKLAAECTS